MKSFVRVKEINGRKYAYEVTPYYDKETKKIRQKSKYLGKYAEGRIKRVRKKLPRNAFDYGEFLPYMRILGELRVSRILRSLLPEENANTLLALALNRAVSPVAMSNMRSWYEGTYLHEDYGELPLSSQALSEFLARVGESSLAMDFAERFIRSLGNGSPLLYDITSLSSSSRLMDILEYGYNRDGLSLPQLNLSLIAHKALGVPLFYDVHPGSVVDVSTLGNTISKLHGLGLDEPTLVLDRGFFSMTNIQDLVEHGYEFILPASYVSKEVRSLVSGQRGDLEKPEHLVMHMGRTLFVKRVKLDMGVEVEGYLYYDMKREQEEKALFYQRLHETGERLKARRIRRWEKPRRVFEDIAGSLKRCLGYRVKDGGFQVWVKKKAVSQRVNRMGVKVVLCRGVHDWREVLDWIREKDVIEKMFKSMKNDLRARPLRAHKTETAKGLIFVTYLALVLRTRLTRLLRETGLAEKYSLPALLLELRKLKRVELVDSTRITTEVTKKQREILKKLELTA
jgi:transposase